MVTCQVEIHDSCHVSHHQTHSMHVSNIVPMNYFLFLLVIFGARILQLCTLPAGSSSLSHADFLGVTQLLSFLHQSLVDYHLPGQVVILLLSSLEVTQPFPSKSCVIATGQAWWLSFLSFQPSSYLLASPRDEAKGRECSNPGPPRPDYLYLLFYNATGSYKTSGLLNSM
jgi:hypothetical protein